jgi:precorrin-6B methylase 2
MPLNFPAKYFECKMLKALFILQQIFWEKMPENKVSTFVAEKLEKIFSKCFQLLCQKKNIGVEINGFKMFYNEYFPDYISFFRERRLNEHEEPAFTLFSSLLQEGLIVIDCGASTGLFTLKACKEVGEEGLVLSFEPDKRRYCILRKNVYLNNYKNVRLFNLALDEHICLDSFVKKADLVTVDVEGKEYEVLKGMGHILKNKNLKIIIEIHRNLISKYIEEKIYELLQEEGFYFFFAKLGGNFSNERNSVKKEEIYYLFATKEPADFFKLMENTE